nr:hypothetical protein CFP56_50671 [Quercus suber]
MVGVICPSTSDEPVKVKEETEGKDNHLNRPYVEQKTAVTVKTECAATLLKRPSTSNETDDKEETEGKDNHLNGPSTSDKNDNVVQRTAVTEKTTGKAHLLKGTPTSDKNDKVEQKTAVTEKTTGKAHLLKGTSTSDKNDEVEQKTAVTEKTTDKAHLLKGPSTSENNDAVEQKTAGKANSLKPDTNISTSTKKAKALTDDNAKSVAVVTNVCKSSVKFGNSSVNSGNAKKQKVDTTTSTHTTTND